MGTFNSSLFRDLAAAADHRFVDKTRERLGDPSDIAGFTKQDIVDLQEFRIGVFKVLMLRAAEFIDNTAQATRISSPADRFALTEFKIMIQDAMIHPGSSSTPSAAALSSVIPNVVAPALYDTQEIGDLRKQFGGADPVYSLACKKS